MVQRYFRRSKLTKDCQWDCLRWLDESTQNQATSLLNVAFLCGKCPKMPYMAHLAISRPGRKLVDHGSKLDQGRAHLGRCVGTIFPEIIIWGPCIGFLTIRVHGAPTGPRPTTRWTQYVGFLVSRHEGRRATKWAPENKVSSGYGELPSIGEGIIPFSWILLSPKKGVMCIR